MKRVNLTAMQTESWEAILPARWRAMRSAPASGVTNMAIDATLLEAAAHREFGVWRTYAWDQPTVSFGRNEAVRGRVDPAALDECVNLLKPVREAWLQIAPTAETPAASASMRIQA